MATSNDQPVAYMCFHLNLLRESEVQLLAGAAQMSARTDEG
jgi:hypothetical protein